MGKIVDYNLTEEIAHGIYVSRLAREVARELNMPKEEEERAAKAGLLHDIGKLRLASYLYADISKDEQGNEALKRPKLIWMALNEWWAITLLFLSPLGLLPLLVF